MPFFGHFYYVNWMEITRQKEIWNRKNVEQVERGYVFIRQMNLKETRWASKLYKYMYTKSMKSRWTLRTRELRSRYLETGGGAGGKVAVTKAVKEVEIHTW